MAGAVRVIAGDVGGTKTILSLFERRAGEAGFRELATTTFPSAAQSGLEAPARAFLDANGGRADAIALGVAGPVEGGRCQTTNLPWDVDERTIGEALGVARSVVINDFEASARGLLELAPAQLATLQAGAPRQGGPLAVLGAGTGLGEAIVVPTPAGLRVLATEGGHCSFAPGDEVEDGLLRFLRREHPGHVSWERVLSGSGLREIYEYVLDAGLAATAPATAARVAAENPAAVVTELGLAGSDPACVRALEIFVWAYGAEAGNLALKSLPTGGLFVSGGIAPRILPALRAGRFVESFLDKGRMRPVLEQIPVHVVTDARVGLYGARALAASLVA